MKRMRILRRDDFRGRIGQAYFYAQRYQWTVEQLTERIAETTYNHPDHKRLTAAERGYLQGYRDALQAQLWQSQVIWRLGPAGGPLAESEQGNWPEGGVLSTLCRLPGELYGGHFWNGTDKAYTAYRPTNANDGIALAVAGEN